MKLKLLNSLLLVLSFGFVLTSCGNKEEKSTSSKADSSSETISSSSSEIINNYTRENNKIYFGTYPQTKVEDETLIAKLNTLAGKKPTSTNLYNWTDYNYYIGGEVTSYMYYQDIDYDNNGTNDYRGVYFTKYRPYLCDYNSSTLNSYQDDNEYSKGQLYWFSYDSIEWNVVKEDNGKALIFASLILDSQDYYSSLSKSSFSHNDGIGYANNYELSSIRKFINEQFYNTVFNDLQKDLIEEITVDNSAESTGSNSNKYACDNTKDKMFLLSYSEAENTNYFSSNDARKAKGSDYAKCQGLYVLDSGTYLGYSFWKLRSPSEYGAEYTYSVYCGGDFYNNYVNRTIDGVRPACWIKL